MTSQANKAWYLPVFGADALRFDETARSKPGPGQVEIKVEAASLNYRDLLVIDGDYAPDAELPFVPASDAAGVVSAVGESVTEFQPGQRVITNYHTAWEGGPLPRPVFDQPDNLGWPLEGVLQRFVTLPVSAVVPAPQHLKPTEAATLPVAGLTAWAALTGRDSIRPGQTVVVQGTGGVSLFALQMAVAAGARVIVTSSDEEKLDRARRLGASFDINYRLDPDWDRRVLEFTDGAGADLVIETVGGQNLSRSVNAAAVNGRIALIGFLEDMQAGLDLIPAMLKELTLYGISVGNRLQLQQLVAAMETNSIHPIIDGVYPAEDLKQAIAHVRRGPFGKVALTFSEMLNEEEWS